MPIARRGAAVEGHARLEPLQHALVRQAVDPDVIDLLDVRRGVEHALGPARVVGQEQQSFARLVQSSYGRDEREVDLPSRQSYTVTRSSDRRGS